MYSPSLQVPQSVRPGGQITPSGPVAGYQTYIPGQQFTSSVRPQTHLPPTQQPGQFPVANSSSKRKANTTTFEIRTPGLQSRRQTDDHRPTGATSQIPPAVPEAPQPTFLGPPPTPRITRLPTPELPELPGSAFCTCHGQYCDKRVHVWMDAKEKQSVCTCEDTNCNKPVHLKMKVQRKKPSGPSAEQHS